MRPVSEAKHNLAQKKKFTETIIGKGLVITEEEIEKALLIRKIVLEEAKAHLHNNPDCSCHEQNEENIDNLI